MPACDESEDRIESVEEGLNLATREDGREVLGSTCALQALQSRHFQAEDALVEEDEGAKGLILSRGREATRHGEVVQEVRGFGGSHVSGVATAVETNERANPVKVGLFGARRVVQSAEGVPYGLEEGHEEVSTRATEMLRGGLSIFSMQGHEVGGRGEKVLVVTRTVGMESGAG